MLIINGLYFYQLHVVVKIYMSTLYVVYFIILDKALTLPFIFGGYNHCTVLNIATKLLSCKRQIMDSSATKPKKRKIYRSEWKYNKIKTAKSKGKTVP